MSNNEISTPNFSDMDIGKLRQYASHLRVPLAKTATKNDIIEAIERKLNGRIIPEIAGANDSPPPGYAKIRVLEDATPGAANIPVYLNANGYVATLPRGVDIIVPQRVVRTLNDAVVRRRKQSIVVDPQTGRETFKETTVITPSYPFQVIDMTPGPEVLTAHELNKKKMQGPRRRYRNLFGHYPKPGELKRAIEQGLISLNDSDVVPETSSAILED